MNVQRLISTHLLKRSALSYLLYPLSLLFGAILILRRKYYPLFGRQYSAPVFIISVGNIVSGGTGKTPFTIFLAQALTLSGIKLAVSQRGYKSGNEALPHLISSRESLLHEADIAGDEAYLTALHLPGIPVVTGKNRKAAIELLLEKFPDLDCIILDDSFQHLKVRRHLDIIMMHESIGLGNGFVLPAGYLREPVNTLRKADCIVTNRITSKPDSHLRQQLQTYSTRIYTGKTTPGLIYDPQNHTYQPEYLRDKRIMLFSAIGNPAGFAQTACDLGFNIVEAVEYPDHYKYKDPAAWYNLLLKSRELQVDYCLTTEKDYTKIRHLSLHDLPLLILPISFVLDKDSSNLIPYIMQRIKSYRKLN